MTQKELLYVEDAVKHETNIINIIDNMIDLIDDNELISFFNNQIEKHEIIKEELICLLEDESNE